MADRHVKRFSGAVVLFITAFLAAALTFTAFSCTGRNSERKDAAGEGENAAAPSSSSGPPASLYLQLVDGLHVTGIPIPVDIRTYRLKVTGAVKNQLNLTFDEVKQFPAVTDNMILECPGFFTDQGDWTGVPVKTILEKAGVADQDANITFIALDDSYRQSFSLKSLFEEDFLIAYQFNGKEFPEIHGFPLRLAAKGKAGSGWVKWLGEIRVEAPDS